jgi:hypothetical protein
VANRIAQITRGGVSVWDVKFELKDGLVNLPSPYKEWLGRMLSEDATNVPPPGITWVDSIRQLLGIFQKHIDGNTSIFYDVPALHFLKLSVVKEVVGGVDRYFFAFKTEFHDPMENEQEYIDDMYQKYGPLMVTVWRHCKGVDVLLEGGDKSNPVPPPGVTAIPPLAPPVPLGGYKLAQSFLQLVDQNQVDNVLPGPGATTQRAHCFFVKNQNASPTNIAAWKKDSTKLGSVATAVKATRNAALAPGAKKDVLFDQLMSTLSLLNV